MLELKRQNGKIYSYIRDKWLVETPEELVRQSLVIMLANDFGYPIDVMAEEYRTDYEGRGIRSTRADLVIYKTKQDKESDYNAFIVVECKAETVKIRQEDFYQGTEYAAKLRAQFLILHNSKETNFYAVDLNKIPNKNDAFIQIITVPFYKDVADEKIVNSIKKQTKTFTREEFTKMLRMCHNIIRNNDKLSPEAAFDEISKILFMKIRYEKDRRGSEVFTLKKFQQLEKDYEEYTRPTLKKQGVDLPYMQILFNDTKDVFREDRLFDENETIKIRQNSFEQILEKLKVYNLSDTQDDVKGIAFEQFLGTTFRGELGQYFTPRTIVDFMTYILDPKEGETICDPTCGSGGFLIKAFEYIRENIEDDVKEAKAKLRAEIEGKNYEDLSESEQLAVNKRIEDMQTTLNKELDTQTEGSRMYYLSRNCIYGTDANPRMARTSKMNMIMHGDGHGGVHHHDGLLNVNGIFEERFDVILTNPPFGARIDKNQKITEADRFTDETLIKKYKEKYGEAYENALKQVNDNIGKKLLSLYDTGSMSGLTEVLFMERCLRLLKKGGRMGMVLPEGVLNTSNLQKVREYFEGRAKIILICSIPQDVFIAAGATVKPSLVFFKRFTEEEENEYAKAKKKAYEETYATHKDESDKLLAEHQMLVNVGKERSKEAKAIRKQLADISALAAEEAKPLVKEYFDYEIPIAMVEDAGITSTGAKSTNNQLPGLKDEYKEYRIKNKLWVESDSAISYAIDFVGKLCRISDGKEVELKW